MSISLGKNPYETLEVTEDASDEEIKQQHRKLVKEFHSDVNKSVDDDLLKEINDAHDTIETEPKRKAYRDARTRAEAEKRQRDVKEKREARRRSQAEAEAFVADLNSQTATRADHGPKPPPPKPRFTTTPPRGEPPITPLPPKPPKPPPAPPHTTAGYSFFQPVYEGKPSTPAGPARSSMSTQSSTTEASWWPWWLVAGAIAVLVLIIALPSGGNAGRTAVSNPATITSSLTPQQLAATKAATELEAANHRIAQLNFKCVKRYICHLAVGGEQNFPLYIEGMDENLHHYLSTHGYTDHWSDSAHTFAAQSVGPLEVSRYPMSANRYIRNTDERQFIYVATASASCECEPGSGLMFENLETLGGEGMYPPPLEHPGEIPWTVLWQLKDRSGHVVRTLRFKVQAGCWGYWERQTRCGRSINDRREKWPQINTPPLFPYGGLEE